MIKIMAPDMSKNTEELKAYHKVLSSINSEQARDYMERIEIELILREDDDTHGIYTTVHKKSSFEDLMKTIAS